MNMRSEWTHVPPTAEKDAPRYIEVRVPLSGSNVRTVVLTACRECGVFVFNRHAHDDHHANVSPPRLLGGGVAS